MAVGSPSLPELWPIAGLRIGTAAAGIKRPDRADLVVYALCEGSRSAAVFTRNRFCAAPVQLARSHLPNQPRWLLVNSGNANAGTGQEGLEDARTSCRLVAELVGGNAERVLPFSTGVIGERLPIDRIAAALPEAIAGMHEHRWADAARAIMTTDTFPKGASRRFDIGGHLVTLTGIAKGAGMIHPDMATMLAFLATDARVAQDALNRALHGAVATSFNRITVDGDTSTNDACVLMATGQAPAPEIRPDTPAYTQFAEALAAVCRELAESIVRDGEGATRLLRILVEGAASDADARALAAAVALSPLVKTAAYAGDPNWGRILAAVGRAPVSSLAIERVRIWLDEVPIVVAGARAAEYTEAQGRAVMARPEVSIRIDLGLGSFATELLTCDLSYDYIRINAEYRT